MPADSTARTAPGVPLSGPELDALARFLTWVRRQWKDRAPDRRREFEQCLRDAAAGYGMEGVWKARHDELAERFGRAVDKRAGDAERTVQRACALYWSARGCKTIRTADLGTALGIGTGPQPPAGGAP